MSRRADRSVRGFAAATWLAALLLVTSGLALADDRPNIVILVADDLGFADPGYRGGPIETPTIDRLAKEGMELERFYVNPICSPTRAALMTGRDALRLGVVFGVFLPWDSGGVHTDERFMSETFQAAGYQTAIVGKWHLGHAQQVFHPNARGFDHFYGHLHTEVGYYPPFGILGGKDFQSNGESIEAEGYETFLLADHASEWIRSRDPERPFFLYLPFLAPHEPLQAPDELVEKYADLEDDRGPARSPSDDMSRIAKLTGRNSRRPLYAAVVDAMDQAMGRVLDTLEHEGLAENTIVLFFSDNGATRIHGRGGGDNAPLRGGKAEVYEGGIRVVSMMRWPARIEGGTKLGQRMSVMDVYPTLAAAAGLDVSGGKRLDGIDMLPALTTGKAIQRERPLFFASEIPRFGSMQFAMIHDGWKLVERVERGLLSVDVARELFRIDDDPGEYNNLAQKHPDVVQSMAEIVLEWRTLHPINGVRGRVSAPPGWHPPKDWADYPRPIETLQSEPASSMAPTPLIEHTLDYMHGDRGRIIYDCEPILQIGGACWP